MLTLLFAENYGVKNQQDTKRGKQMKTNLSISRQNHEAFSILRTNLSRLNLPQELVDELIECHVAVVFEKGALAFCEGNADGMLACILSGFVNVYCPVGDGNRTLVRVAGPGEVIGYPDYIDEKGRRARLFEAQVASRCTLALFSRDHLEQMLIDQPKDVLISIVMTLNTFWSDNVRFFATLLSLPFWDRLTMVLSDLATRAGVQDSEGTILIPELGHEDLAEMIGCSRPMVSRLIAEMIESGLLTRRGKQYVLLKKWQFNDNSRNSKKSAPRFEAPSSGKSSTRLLQNGSANRGVASYAARGSA
jgi:CRP/FNR family cyclic AMP-dependent transcriptional regulator